MSTGAGAGACEGEGEGEGAGAAPSTAPPSAAATATTTTGNVWRAGPSLSYRNSASLRAVVVAVVVVVVSMVASSGGVLPGSACKGGGGEKPPPTPPPSMDSDEPPPGREALTEKDENTACKRTGSVAARRFVDSRSSWYGSLSVTPYVGIIDRPSATFLHYRHHNHNHYRQQQQPTHTSISLGAKRLSGHAVTGTCSTLTFVGRILCASMIVMTPLLPANDQQRPTCVFPYKPPH